MPAPADRRTADIQNALRLMVEALGDEPLNGVAFYPAEPRFNDLLNTTWRELLDQGFIEDRGEKPGPSFRLTPQGWLAGLHLTGALEQDGTRARAITIRRALKEHVKGRQAHYDALIDVRQLAEELQLPVGWVWNAMRANLLSAVFPDHLMNATLDSRQLLVKIPPTFDMQDLT